MKEGGKKYIQSLVEVFFMEQTHALAADSDARELEKLSQLFQNLGKRQAFIFNIYFTYFLS